MDRDVGMDGASFGWCDRVFDLKRLSITTSSIRGDVVVKSLNVLRPVTRTSIAADPGARRGAATFVRASIEAEGNRREQSGASGVD